MTVDVDPRVAEPRADNRVPGIGSWSLVVLGATIAAAWRWLVRGVPPGRTRLSAPTESAFRVWAGVWQLSVGLIVVGVIGFFATDLLPWRAVSATLAVLGLLILLPSLVVVAAIETTVPPPRREAVAAPLPAPAPIEAAVEAPIEAPVEAAVEAFDAPTVVPTEAQPSTASEASEPSAEAADVAEGPADRAAPSTAEADVASPIGVPAPSPLRALAPGVHVAGCPLVFHGVHMGARTTVLDTGDGLLVHSPIDPTPALLDAVRALGTVRWILAPNLLHHLWVKPWAEAFPGATVWAAPGLAARRPDVAWSGTIASPTDAPWPRDVVDVEVVCGHRLVDEIVLLHRPGRTLVVCDLVENLGAGAVDGAFGRLGARLALTIDRPGPPIDWKLTVRDRAKVARSAERVLGWDFDRIVLAHGPLIEHDARAVWSDAFAFVL